MIIFLPKPYRKRQSESTQEAEARRKRNAEAHAAKRQSESTQEAEARRKRNAEAHAAKRQSESTQEAEARRKRNAEAHAAKRQSESTQEAEARRRKDTQAKKRYIAYLCIYLIPLVIIFCFKSRKHDLETEQAKEKWRQQGSTAKQQQRIKEHSAIQSIEEISQVFTSAVKEGPDYICTCCHRLMYRKTVLEFKTTKYTKAPAEFANIYTSAKDKVWVCKTCDYALRRGRVPAQAKANKLDLEDIPVELSDLNPLEDRLLSLRIPFMKMVALPCGKQRAIHGPAVNVPTDLTPMCTLLPRLPSQAQMVPMKLKRKLCYKGHYMYQYVRPAKVLAALEWLTANNPLYKDVQINSDWLDDAARDDADLWKALSAQHCPPPLPNASRTDAGEEHTNQENSKLCIHLVQWVLESPIHPTGCIIVLVLVAYMYTLSRHAPTYGHKWCLLLVTSFHSTKCFLV